MKHEPTYPVVIVFNEATVERCDSRKVLERKVEVEDLRHVYVIDSKGEAFSMYVEKEGGWIAGLQAVIGSPGKYRAAPYTGVVPEKTAALANKILCGGAG